MKINAKCTNVRFAGRGPSNLSLEATLVPECTDVNHASVKDGAIVVASGNILVEFPNESGQHLKTFEEGKDYVLEITPV